MSARHSSQCRGKLLISNFRLSHSCSWHHSCNIEIENWNHSFLTSSIALSVRMDSSCNSCSLLTSSTPATWLDTSLEKRRSRGRKWQRRKQEEKVGGRLGSKGRDGKGEPDGRHHGRWTLSMQIMIVNLLVQQHLKLSLAMVTITASLSI